MVKNQPANAGDIRDPGSIPGYGRSPGEVHDNPLQCSCLQNPMDRGTWQAAICRVAKSWTWLRWFNTQTYLADSHYCTAETDTELYNDLLFCLQAVSDSVVTPWTVAPEALLSMGFPRQAIRVDCHLFLQGNLPTQRANLHLLLGNFPPVKQNNIWW